MLVRERLGGLHSADCLMYSVAVTLPIMFEEAARAGVQPTPTKVDALSTPVIDQLKSAGLWNQAWDALLELDPEWLEAFLAMGADMYRGVLDPKLVELMAVAVDASCPHLYTAGIRRHLQGAFARGATVVEIMEVLKLCGAQGVDACELGTPILVEELARQAVRPNDQG